MKIQRAAAIPLVLHDPFFSVWTCTDRLYDSDTVHWSGKCQKIRGFIKIDDTLYCFMGDREYHAVLPQQSVDVTATATEYVFENEKVCLKVRFTSPLLLTDPLLVSRPCTYVDFTVQKKLSCNTEIYFEVFSDLVTQHGDQVIGGSCHRAGDKGAPAFDYAFMGRACQNRLGGSGDTVTIDWGYVYLASTKSGAVFSFSQKEGKLVCCLPVSEQEQETGLILAYDDLLSINYFGEWRKACWTKEYPSILDAIGVAFADRENVLGQAGELDRDIYDRARAIGGEAYAYLCCLSYRQTVAAHKLIYDEEGNLIFLSKENDSNGCIGTVDVTYPSIPLFLLYHTEYVKGMLRPIFRFADCEVWDADYAPHDVGRYPYAWGQVYGLGKEQRGIGYEPSQGNVYPPFYCFPAGSNVYDFAGQMPVEECGNMLIMTAVVCMLDDNAEFAKPYRATLEKWVQYLLHYGADPGEQLCTDDFAGHLAHNVNLSAKAIMGIEAWARLLGQFGETEEQERYHQKARVMAADWERRASAGDHYMLAFGSPESWSLKYNLVWDKLFGSSLFSKEVYEKELAWYVQKVNRYGTPLDSRREYTKSDWILWCAAMAEEEDEMRGLIEPVADYLEHTPSRVAFSDWYDTVTGEYCHFIGRSVQGGIFMPLLKKKMIEE